MHIMIFFGYSILHENYVYTESITIFNFVKNIIKHELNLKN